MSFVRACALDEVPTDTALAVTVGDYEVAIARHGAEVFALQDLCTHGAVALSQGDVADCAIECWLHGSVFDLRSGKPITLPATEPVATFAVEIRDTDSQASVWVEVDTTLNGVTPA